MYIRTRFVDLPVVYTSLGLPGDWFKASTVKRPIQVLSRPGNQLAVHAGDDRYSYNLERKEIRRIDAAAELSTTLAGVPETFKVSIDFAFWGGSISPDFYYFFKDDQYMRVDTIHRPDGQQSAQVSVIGRRSEWNIPYLDEPVVAIHGVRNQAHNILFIQYDRVNAHDLRNGSLESSQLLTQAFDNWPFQINEVEFAFYGYGQEAETLVLVGNNKYAKYRGRTLVATGNPSDEFPGLMEVGLQRPQLFFAENYQLEIYQAPPRRTQTSLYQVTLESREQTEVMVVTKKTRTRTTQAGQNFFQSQDNKTVKDFRDRTQKLQDSSVGRDVYRYDMNADFDADGTKLYLGEFKANLAVDGGSDELRTAFSKSALNAVENQYYASTDKLEYGATSVEEFESTAEEYYTHTKKTVMNPFDVPQTTDHYARVSPCCALLVLKDVQIGYWDGRQFKHYSFEQMNRMQAEVFSSSADSDRVLLRIAYELSAITDAEGNTTSILTTDGTRINRQLMSAYTIEKGQPALQMVLAQGLIRSAKEALYDAPGVALVTTLSGRDPLAEEVVDT